MSSRAQSQAARKWRQLLGQASIEPVALRANETAAQQRLSRGNMSIETMASHSCRDNKQPNGIEKKGKT